MDDEQNRKGATVNMSSTVTNAEQERTYQVMKRISILLSESGNAQLDKNCFNAMKDLQLTLSRSDTEIPYGLASTIWHELVKLILTKLFIQPAVESTDGSERRRSRLAQDSRSKFKLIAKLIFKDCAPFLDWQILTNHLQLASNLANTANLSILLSTLFHNCSEKEQYDQSVGIVVKLAQDPNVSSKIHRFCVGLLCSLENQTLFLEAAKSLSVDRLDVIAKKFCNWLINASSHQTVSTPQDKVKMVCGKRVIVQEIDGTPSSDIFTMLNLASTYRTEHINNIYSFSMLQRWLLILQKYDAEVWNSAFRKVSKSTRAASAIPRLVGQSSFYLASSASSESSGPASLSSSLSSLNSFLFVDNEADKSKDLEDSFRQSTAYGTPPQHQGSALGTPPSLYDSLSLHSNLSLRRPASVSTPKKNSSEEMPIGSRKPSSTSITPGGLTLKSACIRYCFRVLGQAERSPKRSENKQLLEASVIEAARVLTILCQQDESLVKTVFPEMRRVHSRFLGSTNDARRLYPADIQFFVEHFDSMIYKTEELVYSYLQNAPSQLLKDAFACFEILDFCLRNASFLRRFPFLSKYFPNLLKIIAWHPRSFMYEFLELIPLFMTEAISSELFHSILDIPCTSVMLELKEQSKADDFLLEHLEASLGESDAFLSSSHRKISDFFLRSTSGGPETFDKLDKVFVALAPFSNKTRSVVCCQLVPVLLRKYFECLITQANRNVQRQLFPCLLERIFILFPNKTMQTSIRMILSEQILRLCSINPTYLSVHQDDVIHVFKQIRSNFPGFESVLSCLVYCIGEFSIRPGVCSMEQIAKYYEVVETLLYETRASLFTLNDFPINAKLLSSLISTAGKLAAFSQDFVPKTVICLTKLVNTEWRMDSCRMNQRECEIVMSRASDIVNVLRLPNVSPAVLCSGADIKPWHLSKDSSHQLKIQTISRRQTASYDSS